MERTKKIPCTRDRLMPPLNLRYTSKGGGCEKTATSTGYFDSGRFARVPLPQPSDIEQIRVDDGGKQAKARPWSSMSISRGTAADDVGIIERAQP